MTTNDGPSRRARRAGTAAATLLVGVFLIACTTTAGATPITEHAALQRSDVVVVHSDRTTQWRACPAADRTYDIRGLTSTGVFGIHSNLSVGNDCARTGVVTVGGSAIGTLGHALTWDQVKSTADTDGMRFEATGWAASFGLHVEDLEDGFAPRVGGDPNHNDVRFLLSGAYMDWIRDDAIEDDDLMAGTISDVLIDGTNRFLSAQPSANASISNPDMVVRVHGVVVHMRAMPNDRARDGVGFGGIFKWSDRAGKVNMSGSVFLLDERPIQDEPFPPGSYRNVTLVLGPNFQGRYPGRLPSGVVVTRRMSVWRQARSRWLRTH
jgi:hypothetical protein